MREQHVQVDLELYSHNTTKLTEAQELLKRPNHMTCLRCQENKMSESNLQRPSKPSVKPQSDNKQIGSEIVKMAKQIATLKKQLTDTEKTSKGKDKQLRQLRKCL